MKTEADIINEIVILEGQLFDETCYHDEYNQARLSALYEVLDRDLNDNEKSLVNQERRNQMEENLGEIDEDLLLKL